MDRHHLGHTPLPLGEGGSRSEPGEGSANLSQTLIQPSATFSRREKDLSGPHIALSGEVAASAEKSIPHLSCVALEKRYRKGSVEIPVLRGVDLSVETGELLTIIGQSGSGKSTLLHLLATLDEPDAGEVHYLGRRIDNLPSSGRDTIRNRHLGMIFQFYHLLPELTALENVMAPLLIGHGVISYFRHRRRLLQRAKELLELVGLSHRHKHKPRELSGGEMQRAAIARALAFEPSILLADEPTGNLDRATGDEILHLLRTLNRQQNLTIVMVTHDLSIADQADRVVRLADGRVEHA